MQSDQATAVTANHKDRAGGAPPRNKNAVKHGLYAYQAMLNGKGLDERTSLFKAMREKELELITALGGDPSPQQQAIIADSVKNMLYIASLDSSLMGIEKLGAQGQAASRVGDQNAAIRPFARESQNPWA